MISTPTYLKQGPPVEVTVSIYENVINEVSLALRDQPGLVWQVTNEKVQTKLYNEISRWFEGYCLKKQDLLLPPLALSYCPSFTKQVLEFIKKIPFGSSLSYGEAASKIGSPRAARAVGGALGANPFPLLLPCHRILAAGGKLGGFSCGIEIKKALLAFEAIPYC